MYPAVELVLAGLSVGESYQRVMNALMGGAALPEYYAEPAQCKKPDRDVANRLLLILWGDPALVPIAT